ncbi:MAG: mandelate racemase/muconate lactonizing enzyme family protein [Candidatus Latescibacterota bacterium]|jgi:L-alanine-DL-glutamate epimerase-like enolase superfamily enzyme
MKIAHAERIALNLPFYCERVTRAMHRASTHDERVYLYRLEADNGLVGYGDCQGGHWPVVDLVGRNPASVMLDDRIGFGPQLAALDLVGQDLGVPVHALLGTAVRSRCPFSWWDIDMSAADWTAEARESVKRGYTCFKMKARPWRDIIAQTDAVAKAVPADYKFDVDFNGFLLNQARAEGMLQRLDENPNVGIYESPFYLAQDLDGARLLRERVRKPVVEHFQEPLLHARCCDGFVVGGGAAGILRVGTLAAGFNKPFWLQLVGAGVTAAFAAHVGAVLSHAQLPYITTHELWQHDLLKERLPVVDGYIAVPQGPGLGVTVDEKAVQRYRVDESEPTPRQRYHQRQRLLRISWPGPGKRRRTWEFTAEDLYQRAFYSGNLPGFERGVDLEVVEDDGSPAFKRQHARLREQGR